MKFFSSVLLILTYYSATAQISSDLLTTPELSHYEKTSTSAEVNTFVENIAKASPLVHTETLFTSKGGIKSPLVIMANPKISSPEEAQKSGKVIVYFQGNIHGGEVEGKEALLQLMRDMLLGKKQHLLNNQIVIFAPNYNPDGNDKMGPDNRKSQEHCPYMVGLRRSGEDYDLNRDGTKLEATETKGLMKNLILRWNPDVFVDMHTTNGTWHGNHLTYAPSYHYAGHPATTNYTVDKMLPAIQKAMLDKHHLFTSYYGNYAIKKGWPPTDFYTYNHHPRYLVNQFSLRNKIAILSETFAHDKFYHRINSAHKFASEILEYTNSHGLQIKHICKQAEVETINKIQKEGGKYKNGVRYKMIPDSRPFTLRTYEYLPYTDSSGQTQYARLPNIIEIPGVRNHMAFEGTLSATVPKGYIIPKELKDIVQLLELHGIIVTTLDKGRPYAGEAFMVEKLEVAGFTFEHHNMVTLSGNFVKQTKVYEKGDFRVDMAQPLANLIFYLLEPQSDDGLANWNFIDKYLHAAGVNKKPVEYPIFKYY